MFNFDVYNFQQVIIESDCKNVVEDISNVIRLIVIRELGL